MHSCIFEGFVSHCRFEPIEHRFQYRLYMLYIDLAEASELIGPGKMIANNRRSLCAFLDKDHFNGNSSLDSDIRDLVEHQTSTRPLGPILLLTQLRHFGYYFSPLNLFYVWSTDNFRIESVMAEDNITPLGERYCYVLFA